jgi:two-component system chemotaxis response regulator CheB
LVSVVGRDIVVLASSAGGVEALLALVQHLPAELPASLFVVQHVASRSVLPDILSRAGRLPAVHATHLAPFVPGHIYVAPPDHHLLLGDGYLHVQKGPKENNVRPAADVLFRSAARQYRERVVGVVLSGSQHDGTAGLAAIVRAGGVAVVQDPAEASSPEMPRSALEHVDVEHILPVAKIAALIERLSANSSKERRMSNPPEDPAADPRVEGAPSAFSCPDCGGVLWQLDEGGDLRFRCRVGHAYFDESLVDHQGERLESALWSALRALEEHCHLNERLSRRAGDRGHSLSAARFSARAEEAGRQAALIHKFLTEGGVTPETVESLAPELREDI